MPSPVGHALAGYAVGTLVAGRAAPVLFAAAACLPDIDFLFGTHSTYTHSIGAVAAVAGVSAALFRWGPGRAFRAPLGGGQWRWTLAVACAYGSHLLLDWLGNDASPPIGIMALWPFSRSHYQSPVPLLMPVTRQYWLPTFWMHNLRVLASEMAMFGTLALVTYLYDRRRLGRAGSMNRTA